MSLGTIPVMRGRFGSTEYFLAKIKAKDLTDSLVIPKDIPDWPDLSIEEKFQREIDYKRVREHMAPYLANDNDRFFGALIVDVHNPEEMKYESLTDAAIKLPGMYETKAQSFGFLHFSGAEVLVPLDGQHRLAALKFAISAKDEKQNPIEGIESNFTIAQDDVSVILIKHDEVKARKIFNKVNRYAKPTSTTENLITSDDDIIAILTRKEVAARIGERLVNVDSNTLTPSSPCFTTLPTLYSANKQILSEIFNIKIDTTVLPDLAKQKLYRSTLDDVWSVLLDQIDLFRVALNEPSEEGDAKRREIRASTLLGKPICQLSLVIAYLRLRQSTESKGYKLSDAEICKRLNSLDWSTENPVWQRVLMNGSKVASGRQSAYLGGRFIAYLAGEELEPTQARALEDNYKANFPLAEQAHISLPPRVVN